jgi:hypothetical protein
MKTLLAILLIILLGVGLGVGIAKLRLRDEASVSPHQPKRSSEETTSRDGLRVPLCEPARFACVAIDG